MRNMTNKQKNVKVKKPRIFLPAFLALAILSVGMLATKVKAEEYSNYPPIAQKIAERFNLNVGDVEDVFDEQRDERRADRYAYFTERLDDLVEEGTLTEGQREELIEMHETKQDAMQELRGLEPEQRRSRMQEMHEEMKAWAEGEGIDLPIIGPMGEGFGKGFKGEGFREGMHKMHMYNQ